MKSNEFSNVFCKNIQLLRRRTRLTQKQMAARLSISTKTLSQIESGILPPRLSCQVLFTLCEWFDLQPQDLFYPLEINESLSVH
ncbi:MAG: helix-turn-helix transcriptional regulator [Clostridia bacterium]|nr:helix-turn-helix transcriptional regulator [Clostridia bacterium]